MASIALVAAHGIAQHPATVSKKRPLRLPADANPARRATRWSFGRFVLDESRRELRHDETLIKLEPKPLDLLIVLLQRAGELVTN